ncbi:MAG: DUF4407 domain-containing protein [bacterium]|nr:DUF4407 domain-containing protein [bacterium]
MNKVKEFFWLCSGSNRQILENCPSESSKYVGIGATIFFTGVFAAIAGGYALYTVFDNYFVAAFFAIVWGLMIFNLDRFIVSSMRKNGNPKKEFITALPRIILAILISIVIAKPLELKIFEKEIESEIVLMEQEDFALKENVVKSRFENTKTQLDAEIGALKNEVNAKTESRDRLMEIARQEADGTGGTMQRNPGPIYRIKKQEADRVQQELENLIVRNDSLVKIKLAQLAQNDTLAAAALTTLVESKLNGLASRMEALDRVTDKSSAILIAHWFVLLLFIAVETAPVFVKLISQRGPYDYLLKAQEYGFESGHFEEIAKINTQIKKRTTKMSDEEIEYILARLRMGLEKS